MERGAGGHRARRCLAQRTTAMSTETVTHRAGLTDLELADRMEVCWEYHRVLLVSAIEHAAKRGRGGRREGAPGEEEARHHRLDTTGPIQVQSLMHVAQWSGQHPGWVARKVSCEGHAASSSPPASGSTSQGQWPHACARASGVMCSACRCFRSFIVSRKPRPGGVDCRQIKRALSLTKSGPSVATRCGGAWRRISLALRATSISRGSRRFISWRSDRRISRPGRKIHQTGSARARAAV